MTRTNTLDYFLDKKIEFDKIDKELKKKKEEQEKILQVSMANTIKIGSGEPAITFSRTALIRERN